jgi:hypothetical protein
MGSFLGIWGVVGVEAGVVERINGRPCIGICPIRSSWLFRDVRQ